jgi:two-component system chemotaxis sensor kinase CheA
MELNPDILTELRAEAVELVERLSQRLMLLHVSVDQKSAVERDDIDDLFRTLHSLKGLSEIAGQTQLVSALHVMEDRLSQVREGLSKLEPTDLDCLSEAQALLEKVFSVDFPSGISPFLVSLEACAQKFFKGDLEVESKSSAPETLSTESQNETLSLLDSLTDEESTRWEKALSRPEYLYVIDALQNEENLRSQIVSMGEVVFERKTDRLTRIVFATDLEQSLVEAVVETTVVPVLKEQKSLAGLLGSEQGEQTTPESLLQPVTDGTERTKVNEGQSEEADPEMVKDFLNNAGELLESLTQSLLELESKPSDQTAIEAIFRAAHTIKGTSGMLGFSTIEKLCHVLENTFDRIRKGQLKATPLLIDQLLVGWDLVRELFNRLEQGQPAEIPLEGYFEKLSSAEKGLQSESEIAGETPAASAGSAVTEKVQRAEPNATLRVDLKRLDSLVNLVGELVIDRTRFAQIEEALRTGGSGADLSHQMAETLLLFGRHMNEVQNIIMKVRMVPVGQVFFKFNRVVRDLARQIGKEVDLLIEGGDTELDKTLVEDIGDPLVHLIRNSVDHGIENPAERKAAGKPPKGLIRISAKQQGNMIVIVVSDDGKGLNAEKIRAKAIKNGLIGENDHLSPQELYHLIFEPGFSTAEKVTNISGRGVGMDVVRKNIQKLKGLIELDSTFGQGTKTIIKLPITLAIVPSLMVEASGEVLAIPLVNVIESIRMDPADIQQMGTSRFVRIREHVMPIVSFSEVLGFDNIQSDFWYRTENRSVTLKRRRERIVFVVIGIGHERIGLVVDRLIGQQDIVIKSLGALLRNQSGLAGGCVLGDGRIALVLDVLDVFGQDAAQRGKYARRAS